MKFATTKGIDVHEECIGLSVTVPHNIDIVAKQLRDSLSPNQGGCD